MFCFDNNLHFTHDPALIAMQQMCCTTTSAHFVEGGGSGEQSTDHLHIAVIHAFCETLLAAIKSHPCQPIVICQEDAASHSVGMDTSCPARVGGRL